MIVVLRHFFNTLTFAAVKLLKIEKQLQAKRLH